MTSSDIDGWNLNVQHKYNYHAGILQKGDGNTVYLKYKPQVSFLLIYAWLCGKCNKIHLYHYDVVVIWYNKTMLLIGRHYNNGKRRPKVHGLCLTRLFKWSSWQTKIIGSEINHCCPRWSPLRCWLQHHPKNKSRFYRENYPQAKVSYFLFPLYHFIGYLCLELKWGYTWFWA